MGKLRGETALRTLLQTAIRQDGELNKLAAVCSHGLVGWGRRLGWVIGLFIGLGLDNNNRTDHAELACSLTALSGLIHSSTHVQVTQVAWDTGSR